MRIVTAAALSLAFAASALLPGVAAAQSAPSVYWGAYVDGAPFDTTKIDQFEANAGRRQSIVHWGEPWQMNGAMMPFQTAQYEAVRLRGAIPMIDWLSWNLGAPIDDPNYSLAKIYGGTYDAYLTQWAQAAKAWGHPFFLRFDHEMNGNWYPWSEQRNGNHAGDFVKAWQHVVNIFRSVGANNVTWVWCVNGVYSASTPLPALYPGDNYVDWTAMDAYNRASAPSSWLSFNQIFGDNPWSHMNTYTQVLAVAPSKPLMIAETATNTIGGDAGAWIIDALQTQIPKNFPKVKALVWFNWNGGDPSLHFPIESTSGQKTAFQQSINTGYYASNSFSNLPSGPIQPLPGPASAPSPVAAGSTVRVQAGSAAYTSADGRVWRADTGYSGGATYSVPGAVARTLDPALYQSERYGNFSYNFSVPNGTYTVDLKFAELYWTAAGKRVFNVAINNQPVLTNFDILAQPNTAANTALDKTFTTTVTNGTLSIAFTSLVDNAQVNAIEIVPGTPTRINAGGAAITASGTGSWQADSGFTGGLTYTSNASIGKTLDQAAYQSERYGNFKYDVSVPNGSYRVALKFAETYWTTAGKRVFNVSINNQPVLTNFDILAQPNASPTTAVDRTFPVTVTDGKISIGFTSVADNAQINAIEILPGQ